jgi:hypothetical protein
MNLDEAQKQKVGQWIEEGLKLSDIQSRIGSEFGLRLTYMEVRFLIDDLGVKLKDKPVEPPPAELKGAAATPESPLAAKGEPGATPGKVSVSVDQVTRPSALVSGKVTFSDGKVAEWYLDQTGRLGLAPRERDYKPSQDDLLDFQSELQNELARLGF